MPAPRQRCWLVGGLLMTLLLLGSTMLRPPPDGRHAGPVQWVPDGLRSPIPFKLRAFDPAGRSRVVSLLDRWTTELYGALLENVAFSNTVQLYRPIYDVDMLKWATTRAFDGIGHVVSSQQPIPCTRVFEGPVFYYQPENTNNVWHCFADDLLPMYRMLHELGYAPARPDPRPPTTLILGPLLRPLYSSDVTPCTLLIRQLFDEVIESASITPAQTLCAAVARVGRPFSTRHVDTQELLYYETQLLGQKFLAFMRRRLAFTDTEPRWPPRIVIGQRSGASRIIANPEVFVNHLRELTGLVAEIVVLSESMPATEQLSQMSRTDILLTVHGSTCGHMWFMRDSGVFVHLWPPTLDQFEVQIIRRHAMLRHLGYVSYWMYHPGKLAGWKPDKVFFQDSAQEMQPLITDILMSYLVNNPQCVCAVRGEWGHDCVRADSDTS